MSDGDAYRYEGQVGQVLKFSAMDESGDTKGALLLHNDGKHFALPAKTGSLWSLEIGVIGTQHNNITSAKKQKN